MIQVILLGCQGHVVVCMRFIFIVYAMRRKLGVLLCQSAYHKTKYFEVGIDIIGQWWIYALAGVVDKLAWSI